ncbi:hypothetical protein [Fodinicola acaciae]|uniref:hypothetical protein n=1 Tax=Fodinicola acaciae TaxID=2681555 RepID=UPI0013D36E35|nr:hypothetical protein [Fodinicola acaciae]
MRDDVITEKGDHMAVTTAPPKLAPATSQPRRPRFGARWPMPVVLGGLAVALIVLSLLYGAIGLGDAQGRSQSLDQLAGSSGPLSAAAQDLYRALSDADATATGAFLAGGLEAPAVRDRYELDIAAATRSLATAVAARDPDDLRQSDHPLVILSMQVPVYTGLVETARANNRQGLPIGAAYQREASNLMRTQLLPAAQRLAESESAQVSADQDSAGAIPVLAILVLLVLLGLLWFTQREVSRHANRVVNVGLLAATGAVVLATLWMAVGTTIAVSQVSASRSGGSAQANALAQIRVTLLKARADETLTLVARGNGQTYQDDYGQLTKPVGGALTAARDAATDPAVRADLQAASQIFQSWQVVHKSIRAYDDQGNYDRALALTIGGDRGSAATAFDQLDTRLRDAITRTRTSFEQDIAAANGAMTGLAYGTALLALVAAAGSTYGLWQRLKEYR